MTLNVTFKVMRMARRWSLFYKRNCKDKECYRLDKGEAHNICIEGLNDDTVLRIDKGKGIMHNINT